MLIKPERLRFLAGCGFFLMLALLFIGGHQPASGHLFTPPWDKVVHFLFYGVLTILAAIAFAKLPLPLLGLLIIAIGSADEIHQLFVPGRQAGLDDLAADAIGCLLALMLAYWLRTQLENYLNHTQIPASEK
ncbi:MAG: VanZ family protein [Methylotenera sp.]